MSRNNGKSIEDNNKMANSATSAVIATNTTKLRGYLQVKHNPSSRRARLPRKAWRRQWVVLDIVETLACPALIGRIYNSHMHEDRTLPSQTVTLTDVHGVHRAQSRSHPFAFSLDGSCQCLILSGNSETESQLWMRQIRDLLWPRAPSIWLRTESAFEVSLIDNVHSDIARLRGFYGQLVVDGRDVLLVEARSGADQIRWPIKSLKKWFCPKVGAREDKDKIIVIITHKSCSSGEGIFTFYCRRARELVARLTASSKNQPLSFIEGKKSGPNCKMNPLLALLRRNGGTNQSRSGGSKKYNNLSKSASSADHLDKTGGFEEARAGTSAQHIVALSKTLGRRGLSLERPFDCSASEKKKSASESNLLCAAAAQTGTSNQASSALDDLTHFVEQDFPAPPPDEELHRMSISATLETVAGGEGFYRSFDDLDDIDDHLMGVLAESNPLEAAVVLRAENLSQNGNGRNSFNSSDSGRMSDTYAETSNSSVASSSGHNRLHSNMSNCSGDSGAQLSVNSSSDSNNGSKALEVLKEQDSPDFAPFDQEVYGRSVSISSNSSSSKNAAHAAMSAVYQTPMEAKMQQHQTTTASSSQLEAIDGGAGSSEAAAGQQPRFATVRKSFTLPHGMNNGHQSSASVASTPTVLTPRKRKDLSNFLGLNDEGPGSPTKEVAQSVAMQNLPQENCNEKIEKYLGINQSAKANNPRPRPKSLHGLSLERSQSIDQNRLKAVQSPQAPLSKTLARLQKIKESSSSDFPKSAPTTPNFPTSIYSAAISPKKLNIAKFLGYGSSKEEKSAGGSKNLLQAQLSSLSKSTPMDLEATTNEEDSSSPLSGTNRSWQSNEGLATSGSGGCPTPMEPMSPAIRKILHPSNGLVLHVSHRSSSSASDDRKVGKPLASINSTSASNSPYHSSLGRGRGGPQQQYQTSSLQRGGLGTITKSRGANYPHQSRKLPRSATLDDLEPENGSNSSYYEPVMWVQRPARCQPCCCAQMRYSTPFNNGSLPRYPQNHYDYGSIPRRPPPPVRDLRSNSVAFESPGARMCNSPEPVYLSMNRRRVVIPINGGINGVQITPSSHRETPVDPEYVPFEGSKVVSMGSKTCISVNESSLVSTKAIVHHHHQQQ